MLNLFLSFVAMPFLDQYDAYPSGVTARLSQVTLASLIASYRPSTQSRSLIHTGCCSRSRWRSLSSSCNSLSRRRYSTSCLFSFRWFKIVCFSFRSRSFSCCKSSYSNPLSTSSLMASERLLKSSSSILPTCSSRSETDSFCLLIFFLLPAVGIWFWSRKTRVTPQNI